VGIELSRAAAEIAQTHCERVVVGDAERLDLCAELGDDRFDVILFADVLEHLRDPAALLKRVRPSLTTGGSIVASVPNIAHGSVRLALLSGEFRYRELGLLDNTHLRFFTRESIQDMFEESGYVITQWVRQRLPIDQTEINVPGGPLVEGARRLLADDHEATTYQFVLRALPITADRASLELLAQVNATLAEKERIITELQTRLAAVSAQGSLLEKEMRTVTARADEQERALRDTEARFAAITGSRSWRVARLLSAARQFVLTDTARGRRA
jgi:SAM-dependent methyltransferase